MEIEFLTSIATDTRAYERHEKTFWPDRADAERLIKAGYARPVPSARPGTTEKR